MANRKLISFHAGAGPFRNLHVHMPVILGEYMANRKMVSFLWKGTILEFAFTYPSIFYWGTWQKVKWFLSCGKEPFWNLRLLIHHFFVGTWQIGKWFLSTKERIHFEICI